jgi:hypothetical protein
MACSSEHMFTHHWQPYGSFSENPTFIWVPLRIRTPVSVDCPSRAPSLPCLRPTPQPCTCCATTSFWRECAVHWAGGSCMHTGSSHLAIATHCAHVGSQPKHPSAPTPSHRLPRLPQSALPPMHKKTSCFLWAEPGRSVISPCHTTDCLPACPPK